MAANTPAGDGDRRLQHLGEANARRIPALEAKLKMLLDALNGEKEREGGGQGSGDGGGGGDRGGGGNGDCRGDCRGQSGNSENSDEMLGVLETRIANQQAEWNAQNDAMEQKLAELTGKREAAAAAAARRRQQEGGVSSALAWRFWAWVKRNTKLSAFLALILLLALKRRRLL